MEVFKLEAAGRRRYGMESIALHASASDGSQITLCTDFGFMPSAASFKILIPNGSYEKKANGRERIRVQLINQTFSIQLYPDTFPMENLKRRKSGLTAYSPVNSSGACIDYTIDPEQPLPKIFDDFSLFIASGGRTYEWKPQLICQYESVDGW